MDLGPSGFVTHEWTCPLCSCYHRWRWEIDDAPWDGCDMRLLCETGEGGCDAWPRMIFVEEGYYWTPALCQCETYHDPEEGEVCP